MDSIRSLQADTFEEQLVAFLNTVHDGTRTPASAWGRGGERREGGICIWRVHAFYITGHLPSRNWPPLQPPFHFPSDLDFGDGDHGWDARGESSHTEAGFEQLGEMDLEDIPYDEPPHIKDFPVLEDQGHEDNVVEGGGTLQREEL